jgi:hypothetical protein
MKGLAALAVLGLSLGAITAHSQESTSPAGQMSMQALEIRLALTTFLH